MKVKELLETMNNDSIVAIAIRFVGGYILMKGRCVEIYNNAGMTILNQEVVRTRIIEDPSKMVKSYLMINIKL